MKVFIYCFYLCIDKTLRLFEYNNADKHHNVLISRLDNIGDFLLWRNAAQVLIEALHKEGYCVSLVANDIWADLARMSLNIDYVISVDRKKFIRNIRYWLKIRKIINNARFELAINPVYSRDLLTSDLLIIMSQANNKVGFLGDLANSGKIEKLLSDRFYTKLIEIPERTCHELDKNQLFLSALNIKKNVDIRPKFTEFFKKYSAINLPEKYAVIGVGASWNGKKWPIYRFKILSHWLFNKHCLSVVLLGNIDDITPKELSTWQNVINLCGKTTLPEVGSIIAHSKLVISNDTSFVHFAFAAGVKSICILGGGHFGRFFPYPEDIDDGKPVPKAIYHSMDCFGCNWKCHYPRAVEGHMRCLDNVTVDMVKQEVITQLIN